MGGRSYAAPGARRRPTPADPHLSAAAPAAAGRPATRAGQQGAGCGRASGQGGKQVAWSRDALEAGAGSDACPRTTLCPPSYMGWPSSAALATCRTQQGWGAASSAASPLGLG